MAEDKGETSDNTLYITDLYDKRRNIKKMISRLKIDLYLSVSRVERARIRERIDTLQYELSSVTENLIHTMSGGKIKSNL
jgi:hypothetical protein